MVVLNYSDKIDTPHCFTLDVIPTTTENLLLF